MDEDPLLEEGDKLVFLTEMMEMAYVPPPERIVEVLPTYGTVPPVQLFPEDPLLDRRQFGQRTPNIPQDVPFVPWQNLHLFFFSWKENRFHFFSIKIIVRK